jgi:hypothetical protein
MSESFEDDLRSALKAGVDDDLTVVGLADGARSKLRARRRTAWSGALAAAVVVAAIPVGLSVLGNGHGSSPGVTAESGLEPAATGLADGWHWESYANIEFGVPDSWQHGSPNQWCVSGDRDQAWVSRPDEAQTLVACLDPTNGYGAVIGANGTPKSPGEIWQYTQGNEYPHNAWIITVTAGGVDTLIVAPDQATTQAIADSYRTIDGADANGCASRQDVPRIGTAPAMTPPDSGPIVLCTYSGTATGANLAGSQALSADRARALLEALAAARTSNGMAMPDCAAIDADGTLILRGGEPLGWSFNTGCSDSGVDVGGGTVLPPIPTVLEAIYGYAPQDPADGGDGVVTEDPDGSVSNDGSVVPPDTGMEVPPDEPTK